MAMLSNSGEVGTGGDGTVRVSMRARQLGGGFDYRVGDGSWLASHRREQRRYGLR